MLFICLYSFFLSGYVLSIDGTFANFFRKKFLSLIKPFFIFGILVILCNMIVGLITGNNYNFLENFFYMLIQLKGTPARLWFIPCIFISTLICYFIVKNNKVGIIIFLLLNILAWMNILIFKINFPWYVDTAIIACFFMIIGFIFKEKKVTFYMKSNKLIFLLIIYVFLVKLNSYFGIVDIALNKYGNPFLFYINSMLGILICINISLWIKNKKIIYIGRNSLFFMCLNSISIKFCTVIFLLFQSFININTTMLNLFILLCSITFVYIISVTLNKYFNKLMVLMGF